MEQCSCGRAAAPGDRFCARCGSPLPPGDSGGDPDTAGSADHPAGGDLPLLLETDSDRAVQSEVEVASPGARRWVIAAVVAVAGLTWALSAWPTTDRDAIDSSDAAAAAGQPDAPGAADAGERGTDGDAGAREAADTASGADGSDGSDEADGDTGSWQADHDDAVDEADRDTAPDADGAGPEGDSDSDGDDEDDDDDDDGPPPLEPVVGEETGLGLVFGSHDGGRQVDLVVLDTGVTHELASVRGAPVGVAAGHLIVSQWGGLSSADLGVVEPEMTRVFDLDNGWVDYIRVEDDLIWSAAADGERDLLRAYSIDGEILEEVDVSDAALWYGGPGAGELVQAGTGGVYQRTDDGFERVFDGALRAVGDELVLVDTCDVELRCRSEWRDRTTWEVVDHPAPPASTRSFSSIAGADRWLVTSDWRSGSVVLTEIATGDEVAQWTDGSVFAFGLATPISPDGRWLVQGSPGRDTKIVDLDTGREFELDRRLPQDGAAMFVELAGTAFDS